MFTGLVEMTGVLVNLHGEHLTLRPSKPFADPQYGESVAVNGCCLTLCRTGNRQYMQSCYIAAAPEFCYRILRYLCENGVQPEIWQDVVEELTDTEQLRQKGGALRGE